MIFKLVANPLTDGGWNEAHKKRVVNFLTNKRFMSCVKYAVQFGSCEVLNFIVVVSI